MKKTAFTLMTLVLIFTGTVLGQEKRRPKPTNLGDTATHEVGHKGNRRKAPKQFRPNPSGDGTTQHFFRPNPTGDGTTEQIRKAPNSNAKQKNPNQPGKTRNLLPYIEQDNVYKAKPRKPNANRRAKIHSVPN